MFTSHFPLTLYGNWLTYLRWKNGQWEINELDGSNWFQSSFGRRRFNWNFFSSRNTFISLLIWSFLAFDIWLILITEMENGQTLLSWALLQNMKEYNGKYIFGKIFSSIVLVVKVKQSKLRINSEYFFSSNTKSYNTIKFLYGTIGHREDKYMRSKPSINACFYAWEKKKKAKYAR